ncbi:MAG TPA: DUF58 domain-containing protein [Pseudomonadales bacterium]|nr:DUF58 domain-containing protein [Pseudomonadales bacterium]
MCAVLGIDTDMTLIYQLFALMFCMIVIARISLAIHRPRVTVRRRLPRYATAHEPFEYFVDMSNVGDKVEGDLTLVDNPLVRPPTIAQFRSRREPGEETRNAYDRWLGFYRFIWLQRLNTGITTTSVEVPDIAIKSRARVRIEATPLRRGVVNFESLSVLHPDPLGLNFGILEFPARDELLVLPRHYRISANFELPGGRHFQPGGVGSTWSIGESEEFVSLRDYRDGDSMRKIHWPSTARRSKPVVKEYQDEYFVRQALVLDTSTSDDEVLEEAISVAASFVLKITGADSMLDLLYLSRKLEVVTSGRGNASVAHQLEALAGLGRSPLPATELSDAILRFASVLSGCILVLTDWDETRRRMVERLMSRGLACEVFLITRDPEASAAPPFVHVLEVGHVEDGLAKL